MVVFARDMSGLKDAKFTGHAKVDAEPRFDSWRGGNCRALKSKKNLFRGGGGGAVTGMSEIDTKGGSGRSAE
jgi:hypothetical protein